MGEKAKPSTGGCLHGAVAYESTASPVKENCGYCHCRMCQKAYGTWGMSVKKSLAGM